MNKKYQIILADPPWSYNDKGCNGATEKHYKGMKIKDICALSVDSIADKNCVLFLWATYPMLQEALEAIKSWGFTYKSIAFQWVKLNKKNKAPFYGLGRWTRGNTEPCLLAVRGKPRRVSNSVFQLIQSPIEGHSKKPVEVHNRIVKLMGDLPRIELFARERLHGWDALGYDIDGQDIRESLTGGIND